MLKNGASAQPEPDFASRSPANGLPATRPNTPRPTASFAGIPARSATLPVSRQNPAPSSVSTAGGSASPTAAPDDPRERKQSARDGATTPMPQHAIRMATPALARPAGVKRADHEAPTLHRDAHRERTAAQKGRGQADPPPRPQWRGSLPLCGHHGAPFASPAKVLRYRFHLPPAHPLQAKGVRAARLPLETFQPCAGQAQRRTP